MLACAHSPIPVVYLSTDIDSVVIIRALRTSSRRALDLNIIRHIRHLLFHLLDVSLYSTTLPISTCLRSSSTELQSLCSSDSKHLATSKYLILHVMHCETLVRLFRGLSGLLSGRWRWLGGMYLVGGGRGRPCGIRGRLLASW